MGVRGEDAAKLSFLLSVPAVGGAVLLKIMESIEKGGGGFDVATLGMGAVVAGVVGYGCLRGLLGLLKKARFHHFAWYCWGVGLVSLGAWWMGR